LNTEAFVFDINPQSGKKPTIMVGTSSVAVGLS